MPMMQELDKDPIDMLVEILADVQLKTAKSSAKWFRANLVAMQGKNGGEKSSSRKEGCRHIQIKAQS